MKQFIFLTGMPGSGKSWWGRHLSAACEIPFIDLDEVVEQKTNLSIAAIIQRYGEPAFRELETRFLQEVISSASEPILLSTGGGAILSKDNRRLFKQHGYTIYLKAGIDFLMERLRDELHLRPLLTSGPDLRTRLEELLILRKPMYEQSDLILQVEHLQAEEFERIIRTCIEQQS